MELDYEAFFSNSLDLLCIAGFDGYFKKVNPAWSRALGFTEEELTGRPFIELVHKEDRERTLREMERLRAGGGPPETPFENRFVCSDGSYRVLRWATLGTDGAFYSIARDITESRKREIELAQASKMATLGEMASSIAHEINTPLSIIGNYAHQLTILAESKDTTAADWVEVSTRITAVVERIARIIGALKRFAREGSQDKKRPIRASEILDETLQLVEQRFRGHGIALEVSIEPAEIQVPCRPVEISQVLLNLMNNAFDALSSSKGPRRVRVEVREKLNSVEFSVADNGPGIPADARERIFEPFFTTKEVGKGTGLGLSISRGIVESHAGTLYLDLNPALGAGCRLVFELPK